MRDMAPGPPPTQTALLAKYGLLDTDREPTDNDLPPTEWQPGDYEACWDDSRCDYCGRLAWRTDPFGQRPCCRPCFLLIISGEEADR